MIEYGSSKSERVQICHLSEFAELNRDGASKPIREEVPERATMSE